VGWVASKLASLLSSCAIRLACGTSFDEDASEKGLPGVVFGSVDGCVIGPVGNFAPLS
jgi:hypothetical protein